MNSTYETMNERVANGCDPLSGRPMQVVGKIMVCRDGKCRDSEGTEVTVSDRGDWVPVAA